MSPPTGQQGVCTPVRALQCRANTRLVVSRRTAQEVRGCCLSSLRVVLPVQQVPVCDMWPLRAPSDGSSWLSLLYLWSSPRSCPRSFLLHLKHVGVPRAPKPRGINLGPDTPPPILVQPAQKNWTAGSGGEKQIQSVPYRKCTLKSVQQPRCNEYGVDRSLLLENHLSFS